MIALPTHYIAAKQWAEEVLRLLAAMPQDDRHLWNATKPAGHRFFNHRRVSYVAKVFPEYRPRFERLGLLVR